MECLNVSVERFFSIFRFVSRRRCYVGKGRIFVVGRGRFVLICLFLLLLVLTCM